MALVGIVGIGCTGFMHPTTVDREKTREDQRSTEMLWLQLHGTAAQSKNSLDDLKEAVGILTGSPIDDAPDQVCGLYQVHALHACGVCHALHHLDLAWLPPVPDCPSIGISQWHLTACWLQWFVCLERVFTTS